MAMLKFIPQNFDVNMCTGFQILQLKCHVKKFSKFQQKIHSKWKMWMLNFEQQVSADAEDSQVCLWYCTAYPYFTSFHLF